MFIMPFSWWERVDSFDSYRRYEVVQVFGAECYWRDIVAFTWNIKTMEGHEAIRRSAAAAADSVGRSLFSSVFGGTFARQAGAGLKNYAVCKKGAELGSVASVDAIVCRLRCVVLFGADRRFG